MVVAERLVEGARKGDTRLEEVWKNALAWKDMARRVKRVAFADRMLVVEERKCL